MRHSPIKSDRSQERRVAAVAATAPGVRRTEIRGGTLAQNADDGRDFFVALPPRASRSAPRRARGPPRVHSARRSSACAVVGAARRRRRADAERLGTRRFVLRRGDGPRSPPLPSMPSTRTCARERSLGAPPTGKTFSSRRAVLGRRHARDVTVRRARSGRDAADGAHREFTVWLVRCSDRWVRAGSSSASELIVLRREILCAVRGHRCCWLSSPW